MPDQVGHDTPFFVIPGLDPGIHCSFDILGLDPGIHCSFVILGLDPRIHRGVCIQ